MTALRKLKPIGPVIAGGLYFLFAVSAIELAHVSAEMTTFWPANGFLVYVLLVNRPESRWKFLLSALIGSLCANLLNCQTTLQAVIFTAANLGEAVMFMALLRRWGIRRGQLLSPNGLIVMTLAALAAAAVSATLADLGETAKFGRNWLSWFGSDALGMILMLPALLVMFGKQPLAKISDCLFVYSAVAAVAVLLFIGNSAPITFFGILPVYYAVFRFGGRGAINAILIIAGVSIVATLTGHGPFAAWTDDRIIQIYLLQSFLAALLLAGLPMASIRATQQRTAERILRSEREHRLVTEQRRRLLETQARETAVAGTRDSLTRVRTRARILAVLANKLAFARRKGMPLAAAILDIDRFKQVNDIYGHAAGDTALRGFGALAAEFFAAPHAVGRIGGEEFLVVLVGLEPDEAMARIDLFRNAIADLGKALAPDGVTFSAGLTFPADDDSVRKILGAADHALLRAKRNGRNCTLLAAA